MLPSDAGPTEGAAKATPAAVPHARFNEVNTERNELRKQVEEFKKQLESLAWAKDINQQAVIDSIRWRSQSMTDPEAFIEHLVRTAPPEIAPRVKSALGRWLATRNDPEPEPDFQTADGQRFYSADQSRKWHEWQSRQQEEKFAQQLEPLKRELMLSRQQRVQAQAEAQSKAFAGSAVEKAQQWPFFNDHLDEIAKVYAEQPIGKGTPEEEMLALHEAYLTVLRDKVLPSISQTAEAKAVADFKTKAAASTESPGRATTTQPKRAASMREALERAAAAANWRP